MNPVLQISVLLLCLPLLSSLSWSCKDIGTITGGELVPMYALLDATVDGRTVVLVPDQRIGVELDVLADAGFLWYWTSSDSSVVTVESHRFRQKDPGPVLPGGSVLETMYIRALRRGEATVTLQERQGWMQDVPARTTVRFTVRVD